MKQSYNDLQNWMLHDSLGRYILSVERCLYHNWVKNIFGYNSLQINFNLINFLQGNKISNKIITNKDIICDLNMMPFETESIDLIISPHSLEFMPNYYHFLEECHRIMALDGKMILTCFNPISLLRMFQYKINPLKTAQFIPLNTLKNQLHKLNFSIEGGSFIGYRPPISNHNIIKNLKFIEYIGDRWIPSTSNVYALLITKKTITTNLVSSNKKLNLSPNFAGTLSCRS